MNLEQTLSGLVDSIASAKSDFQGLQDSVSKTWEQRKQLTNDRIIEGLRAYGFVQKSELEETQKRVALLEEELKALKAIKVSAPKKKAAPAKKTVRVKTSPVSKRAKKSTRVGRSPRLSS